LSAGHSAGVRQRGTGHVTQAAPAYDCGANILFDAVVKPGATVEAGGKKNKFDFLSFFFADCAGIASAACYHTPVDSITFHDGTRPTYANPHNPLF